MKGPAILPPAELMFTILPGIPFLAGSVPRSGRNALVTTKGPTRLISSWVPETGRSEDGPGDRQPRFRHCSSNVQHVCPQMLSNLYCLGLDPLFISYVKKQWNNSFTKVSLQAICVRLIPHAAIHSEFAAEE